MTREVGRFERRHFRANRWSVVGIMMGALVVVASACGSRSAADPASPSESPGSATSSAAPPTTGTDQVSATVAIASTVTTDTAGESIVGGRGAVPPPPLDQRVAESELVVAGQIVSMDDISIRISVSEVLRGDVKIGDVISLSPDTPPAVGQVEPGNGGVWLVDTMPNPPVLLGGGPFGPTVDEVRVIVDN